MDEMPGPDRPTARPQLRRAILAAVEVAIETERNNSAVVLFVAAFARAFDIPIPRRTMDRAVELFRHTSSCSEVITREYVEDAIETMARGFFEDGIPDEDVDQVISKHEATHAALLVGQALALPCEVCGQPLSSPAARKGSKCSERHAPRKEGGIP